MQKYTFVVNIVNYGNLNFKKVLFCVWGSFKNYITPFFRVWTPPSPNTLDYDTLSTCPI